MIASNRRRGGKRGNSNHISDSSFFFLSFLFLHLPRFPPCQPHFHVFLLFYLISFFSLCISMHAFSSLPPSPLAFHPLFTFSLPFLPFLSLSIPPFTFSHPFLFIPRLFIVFPPSLPLFIPLFPPSSPYLRLGTLSDCDWHSEHTTKKKWHRTCSRVSATSAESVRRVRCGFESS